MHHWSHDQGVCILECPLVKKTFGGHQSFLWATDTSNFGLLVTSALAFKARVDPIACMPCCLHVTNSSNSPLVQHLLTFCCPAWQLSCSTLCTGEKAVVFLESGIYCTAASQCETRLYRLSYARLTTFYLW